MNPQDPGELRGELGWVVCPPTPTPRWAVAYEPKLLISFSSQAICGIQAGKVLWPCHLEAPEEPHSYGKPGSGLSCAPRLNPRGAGVACQQDFERFHLLEMRKAEEGRLLGCRLTSWDWGLGSGARVESQAWGGVLAGVIGPATEYSRAACALHKCTQQRDSQLVPSLAP